MSHMKTSSSRIKSKILSLTGRKSKERGTSNSLGNKLSVNEEYKATLRTESYIEMWSKVQGQLKRISFDKLVTTTSSTSISLSSSSSSIHLFMHLSKDLLEPRQEMLNDMISNSDLHHFLVEYFQVSLEAYNICELILRGIHQARHDYQVIKKLIKLAKKLSDHSENYTDGQCHVIHNELSKFALLNNPLSVITQPQFHAIHDNYNSLLRRMTSKYKRVKKRSRLTKFCKKFLGLGLIASYSMIAIALIVLAFHSIIGIAVAPFLMACPMTACFKRRVKSAKKGLETSLLDKLGKQIDIASKGLYILVNDFDTMSRIVGRLRDEIEHSKAIANVCIRNKGRGQVLKQVMKEFDIHEPYFMEQLEELEEHIYLCFLTIDRSRKLVLQEIFPMQSK